jgi:hypothetical protein
MPQLLWSRLYHSEGLNTVVVPLQCVGFSSAGAGTLRPADGALCTVGEILTRGTSRIGSSVEPYAFARMGSGCTETPADPSELGDLVNSSRCLARRAAKWAFTSDFLISIANSRRTVIYLKGARLERSMES